MHRACSQLFTRAMYRNLGFFIAQINIPVPTSARMVFKSASLFFQPFYQLCRVHGLKVVNINLVVNRYFIFFYKKHKSPAPLNDWLLRIVGSLLEVKGRGFLLRPHFVRLPTRPPLCEAWADGFLWLKPVLTSRHSLNND